MVEAPAVEKMPDWLTEEVSDEGEQNDERPGNKPGEIPEWLREEPTSSASADENAPISPEEVPDLDLKKIPDWLLMSENGAADKRVDKVFDLAVQKARAEEQKKMDEKNADERAKIKAKSVSDKFKLEALNVLRRDVKASRARLEKLATELYPGKKLSELTKEEDEMVKKAFRLQKNSRTYFNALINFMKIEQSIKEA